jgi:hypothetical protein
MSSYPTFSSIYNEAPLISTRPVLSDVVRNRLDIITNYFSEGKRNMPVLFRDLQLSDVSKEDTQALFVAIQNTFPGENLRGEIETLSFMMMMSNPSIMEIVVSYQTNSPTSNSALATSGASASAV